MRSSSRRWSRWCARAGERRARRASDHQRAAAGTHRLAGRSAPARPRARGDRGRGLPPRRRSPTCRPTRSGPTSTSTSRHSSARSSSGPSASLIPEEEAYRFRHLLIREAVYARCRRSSGRSSTSATREWLARTADESCFELDEIVGYHLEQALVLRQELGMRDEELAARAARAAPAAGLRALGRADHPAAAGLLQRAARRRRRRRPDAASRRCSSSAGPHSAR